MKPSVNSVRLAAKSAVDDLPDGGRKLPSITLSQLISKTNKLDDSINEVWGDSKAQSERDIKSELEILTDDFYKFLFEAEDSIFQLKRSNQSLQKRVNYLTERLDTLENEKDSSILNKLKRGF